MPNALLSQKLRPSKQLAQVLGDDAPINRAEAVKKFWDYVKEHDLQNPKNRREILADPQLKPLLGKDKVSMFEVAKIINDNLEKPAGKKAPEKAA